MTWTFLLVSVVLNVATTQDNDNNTFYGLAIGFTVLAGIMSVGDISGAVFNPAVGTGPFLWHLFLNQEEIGTTFYAIALYWVSDIIGSLLAAGFFRITNWKEYEEEGYEIISS